MELNDKIMRSFMTSKVFNSPEIINSIDFAPAGDYVVSGSSNQQIVLYDSICGKQSKVTSTVYGVDLIIFGHTSSTVLHTSTHVNDTIRYLSLHQNKYIRYFIGHINKVVSLNKSPVEDIFVSASLDKSLMFWDLRSPRCEGHLQVGGSPLAAFDPNGLVLAVGINSKIMKLFDIRNLKSGSFITVNYAEGKDYENWTELKFSPNGEYLLISSGPFIRLVDAFNGNPVITCTGHQAREKKSISIEASFSPDSKYIVSGSIDGNIHVWDVKSGTKVGMIESFNSTPIHCIKFNPKYLMIATTYKNMEFWLPKNILI